MILNPVYYGALVGTQAGALSYAARMQNLYGGLILGGGTLNADLGNQIANTYNGLTGTVQSTAQAAAWQSMAAWMFYSNDQGLWDGDSQAVQKLADNIIEMAIQYGVACCHHTCKNLDFNMKIIQSSSLSPDKKAQYADILATATLTNPLYVLDDAPDNGDGQSETSASDEVLINGTTEDSGESSGGQTPVGDQPVSSQNDADSASSQSSSDSSSSSNAGEDASQGDAYEISKSSPAKSASAEASMPIVVIIAIIVLIAIFMVGYIRNKDDFDDY